MSLWRAPRAPRQELTDLNALAESLGLDSGPAQPPPPEWDPHRQAWRAAPPTQQQPRQPRSEPAQPAPVIPAAVWAQSAPGRSPNVWKRLAIGIGVFFLVLLSLSVVLPAMLGDRDATDNTAVTAIPAQPADPAAIAAERNQIYGDAAMQRKLDQVQAHIGEHPLNVGDDYTISRVLIRPDHSVSALLLGPERMSLFESNRPDDGGSNVLEAAEAASLPLTLADVNTAAPGRILRLAEKNFGYTWGPADAVIFQFAEFPPGSGQHGWSVVVEAPGGPVRRFYADPTGKHVTTDTPQPKTA